MKHTVLAIMLFLGLAITAEATTFPANDPSIRYVGRTLVEADGSVSFDWSGTYFSFRFTGPTLAIRLSDTRRNYYNVTLDGERLPVMITAGKDTTITLATHLPGEWHEVTFQKRSEAEQGKTTIHEVLLAPKARLLPNYQSVSRHIEFIGDSHTCGYGTEGKHRTDPFLASTENCDLTYAAILSRYFDADYTLIAHSGWGVARNYGYKKSTTPRSMKDLMMQTFDMDETIPWESNAYKPSLVVINLGSNDFSTKPHPTKKEFTTAYKQIIRQIGELYGPTPILCVAPVVNTTVYEYIKEVVAEEKNPQIRVCQFLRGHINGTTDLGSSAHPNYSAQKKMAMIMLPFISTMMDWPLQDKPIE